jgi:hypothetical protein
MNIEIEYYKLTQEQLKLADQFALGFYHWMMKNDTMENAEKWFGFSDENMLETYKRELKKQ